MIKTAFTCLSELRVIVRKTSMVHVLAYVGVHLHIKSMVGCALLVDYYCYFVVVRLPCSCVWEAFYFATISIWSFLSVARLENTFR